MATMLKEVDAVCIGVGFTGSILARELTKAGLKVVGLERGADRSIREDFTLPSVRDDLKYAVRQELFQDTQTETVTLRHSPSETALPLRRLGSFLPGTGVGGAGSHWNGVTWRLLPSDHNLRSHLAEPLRPRCDSGRDDHRGLSGLVRRARALLRPVRETVRHFRQGRKSARQDHRWRQRVRRAARQNEYPNQPLVQTMAGSLMEKAAKDLGYHPFPAPSANMSGVYTNPEGVTLGACEYCGHCERFGCEANAKASPQACILPVLLPDPKFELRTYAYVKELVYDKQAKKVKAVRYVDTRSGEEFEQPAGLVIMGAYVFNNVLLMLTAGIGEPYDHTTGKGAVGKNYCYQVSGNGVTVFFESKEINPFMAAGAHGTNIDDFNGDNFDHSGLGFFGGAWISAGTPNGRPILHGRYRPARRAGVAIGSGRRPNGTITRSRRRLGLQLCAPRELSRPRPDLQGRAWTPARPHELQFPRQRLQDGGVPRRRARPDRDRDEADIKGNVNVRRGNYNVVPYQSTHNTGGTMMGSDPKTSAVNRYCQAWDAGNLFVMGASLFPQNASYNPTGLVGALAYWSAEAIGTKYLKRPGPLVHA